MSRNPIPLFLTLDDFLKVTSIVTQRRASASTAAVQPAAPTGPRLFKKGDVVACHQPDSVSGPKFNLRPDVEYIVSQDQNTHYDGIYLEGNDLCYSRCRFNLMRPVGSLYMPQVGDKVVLTASVGFFDEGDEATITALNKDVDGTVALKFEGGGSHFSFPRQYLALRDGEYRVVSANVLHANKFHTEEEAVSYAERLNFKDFSIFRAKLVAKYKVTPIPATTKLEKVAA